MVSVRQYEHSPTPPPPTPEAHTAIVFYGIRGDRQITAVTRHRVNNGTLGLGEVINGDELAETVLQSNVTDSTSQFTLMPENIILDNHKFLIWYTKRKVMPMWFRTNRTFSVDVEWTPLLFIADKQSSSLRMLALANNSRPHLNTRLYYAPLMNIYHNHTLCQGTARLPEKVDSSCIDDCVATLTESVFTHVNHSDTLKSRTSVTNEEHIAFWKNKAKNNDRVRASELEYAGRLSEFMNKLA